MGAACFLDRLCKSRGEGPFPDLHLEVVACAADVEERTSRIP